MRKIISIAAVFVSALTVGVGTAYSQTESPSTSAIAYLLASELSEDFNIVTYESDETSTTVQMHGDYITEYSAKTIVMSRIVKRYSDVEVMFPWAYVRGFLSTMLRIEGLDNNIVLLLKESGHACELFIVVYNGDGRQQ